MGKKSRQKRLRRQLRPWAESMASAIQQARLSPSIRVVPEGFVADAPKAKPKLVLPTAAETVRVGATRA